MKNLKCILLFAASLFALGSNAQEKKIIYVESAKVTAPLMQKWISEYSKENMHVEIKMADKKVNKADITLDMIVNGAEDNLPSDKYVLCVARYAILPVTCKCNSI